MIVSGAYFNQYHSRVVIYNRRAFSIRLANELKVGKFEETNREKRK